MPRPAASTRAQSARPKSPSHTVRIVSRSNRASKAFVVRPSAKVTSPRARRVTPCGVVTPSASFVTDRLSMPKPARLDSSPASVSPSWSRSRQTISSAKPASRASTTPSAFASTDASSSNADSAPSPFASNAKSGSSVASPGVPNSSR